MSTFIYVNIYDAQSNVLKVFQTDKTVTCCKIWRYFLLKKNWNQAGVQSKKRNT